jgi:YVTN family beta-propeller protein
VLDSGEKAGLAILGSVKQSLDHSARRSMGGNPRTAPPGRHRKRNVPPFVGLVVVLIVLTLSAGVWASRLLERSAPAPTAAAAPRTPSTASPQTQAPAPTDLPRHQLRVTTQPSGARLTILAADGSTQTRRTPFRGRVAEGRVQLTLARSGYNRLTRVVDLDRKRTLDLWLDPRGLLHHKVREFATGPAPKQVAFSPDGREIWVSVLGGAGVQVFDADTYRLIDTINLGRHGAVEVIFTGDGSTVYASQMETASVFEIDRETREVRRQLFTTGTWSKVMALSPDEKTLYVSNWVSDDVSEIDLRTGREVRRIPTVDTPRGLYVSANGRRLYVAGFENGELERINLKSGASKVLLRTGGAMRHLVGDARGRRLYADDMATDEVYVLDLATGSVRKLADTDNTPNTIDLSPDGRVLYISNRGRNNPVSYYIPGPEWGSVLAIDSTTGRILDAIVGGNQTTGLDVSPDGRTLAFSDFLDDRVQIYAIPPFATLANGGGGRAGAHLADLQK